MHHELARDNSRSIRNVAVTPRSTHSVSKDGSAGAAARSTAQKTYVISTRSLLGYGLVLRMVASEVVLSQRVISKRRKYPQIQWSCFNYTFHTGHAHKTHLGRYVPRIFLVGARVLYDIGYNE
jgi:hypothetical protein